MVKERHSKNRNSTNQKNKIHWGKISWYLFLVVIIILFIINNTRKDDSPAFQYPPGTRRNLYENPLTESIQPAFDFKLKSIEGKDVKLSDFRGKVVVIDFWATWCLPCKKGIPDLIDIQKNFAKDVQVIGITVDQDPLKVVPPFIKEYKINYPILISNDEVLKQYGDINAIPTTFIIDRKGNIINRYIGLVEKELLISELRKALQT